MICPPSELVDKLGMYAELGIDEIIFSASFGQSQQDLLESMYRIHDKVMPYLINTGSRVVEWFLLRLINI